ncbi:MAG: hypothetical protein ACI9E3_000983 [Flavobacteriales bacterium]|jgi:hypothetical protein
MFLVYSFVNHFDKIVLVLIHLNLIITPIQTPTKTERSIFLFISPESKLKPYSNKSINTKTTKIYNHKNEGD